MNNNEFFFHPQQASTVAPEVDALYFFLVTITVVFSLLVAALIIYFAIRYRRSAKIDRTPFHPSVWMEVSWLVLPLPLLLGIFVWSADVYFTQQRPPAGAMEFTVVAKQWMWKLQHPSGRREIDTLHVPKGQPIRLQMISQDVIHSFYVPAFRMKQDVLPGRYTQCWFEATQTGEFHLFCAEYCGTNHSRMTGKVIVMEPDEYQAWLAGGSPSESPVVAGQKLFEQLRCDSCHLPQGGEQSRGPSLANLAGKPVTLTTGDQVTADDNYLRESILRSANKVVAGYQPIMPSYEGQIGEEQVLQLIAYIRSMGAATEAQK
ncbi:MAG: cytochrome c oxidase subunit II [Pirellulales bacterium]